MIARSWDGLTPAGQTDAYTEYIRRTGFKDLLATNGNRGVFLLRRREGEKTRFRVMSLWDSMDGIRRFAGDDPERARYYPDDERFLTALDPNVEHFEVVGEGGTRAAAAEAGALARELETLGRGDAWHGPALAELLVGVSAATASARPIASAHTIWEVVLHVTAWTDVFRRRLDGEAVEEPEAGDFPAPPSPTRKAWAQAMQALFEGHRALTARVARLGDAELGRRIPNRDFDVRFQVRAAIRHIVYHSGQIGLCGNCCTITSNVATPSS
jgi:heme-degrading monooxygenase HmoA/uncharacterized damage-inducible protein DinB